jgi:hypothetical protein
MQYQPGGGGKGGRGGEKTATPPSHRMRFVSPCQSGVDLEAEMGEGEVEGTVESKSSG